MTLGRIQGASGAHHSPIVTSMAASDMLETHFSARSNSSGADLGSSMPDTPEKLGDVYKCGVGDSEERGSADEVPGPEGGNICSPKLAFWTHLQLRGAPEQERLTRLLQHKRGSHDCLHRIQSYRGPLPFIHRESFRPTAMLVSSCFGCFPFLSYGHCPSSLPFFFPKLWQQMELCDAVTVRIAELKRWLVVETR
jgi:hypothetical protein